MTTELGIDHTGTWTAHQYVIDAGYDRYSVEMTAEHGVSEAELDGLTSEQVAAVEAHCRRECAK